MPLPKPTTSTPRSTDAPSSRLQFFKVHHLHGKEQSITINSVTAEPTQYSDVQVKLSMGSEKYLWGLRVNSLAFAALYALFGEDEKAWSGKTFTAKPEFNTTFEQDTIVVVNANTPKPRTAGRSMR